ncbi:uncharacterized protein synpo [Diretmus argenteus]
MEMDRGHMSIRRGVSWSPGGMRKPLQATQDTHAPSTECNASWEKNGFKGEQTGRKTNLTRSASLSEKELKEARVRSQIIAAQLTIPSNSNSRGVQLFNRRKQRVKAFTRESCGEGSGEDRAENVKANSSSNKLTWAERSTEEKDTELNCKNSVSTPLWSPTGTVHRVADIMEDPGEHFHQVEDSENSVIQERHFLPVKEQEEQEETVGKEEAADEVLGELEDNFKDETPLGSDNNAHPARLEQAKGEGGMNGAYTETVSPGKLLNGCHSNAGPDKVSVSTSKQTTAIINRTARPFFSPPTVQSPEAMSPVMDIPPAPSYSTPPLPAFTGPHPVAFSPPPPPPSYPTPPLPAFTNQPARTYSGPAPMSPVMSPTSPPVFQPPSAVAPVSQYVPPNPPMPHCGPPTAPRPSTFVPKSTGEGRPITPMKTGILEEGAAKRANRKSMFTFKEKPVVAPNPELLSLVQGADERKKHGHRSVPEPVSEEELLALGAEASNFLATDEERTETATAPEWASCLKSSRTRARAEHRPEQTLTNASGKGAELFAKRQSRMEKYVLENKNAGQMRSPSPTMSLPPSWVYPSNMPGRVKAIAKNSDVCAQLSQNHKTQQTIKRKPTQKAPPPEPVPETPPLENGCTKIEMDLSRHRPYQLSSSLFILNPIKDAMSSLPRGAPPPRPLISSQSFSRQTSLYQPSHFNSQASHMSAQCMSPQLPLSATGGIEYPSNYRAAPASGQPSITSPVSAFSPERVSSPRSGVQAPRPTFSAKRAGIEPQVWRPSTKKESSTDATPSETPTPTRTPSLTRRFSSTGSWSPSLQTNQPTSNITSAKTSVISPVSPPWGSRCQSPMVSQNTQPSISTSRPTQTSTATSPLSPPWGSRCQSPMVSQNTQPSAVSSISTSRPTQTSTATSPLSPPWGSRCQSPTVSQTSCPFPTTKPLYTSTATSPVSPSRESRCMSPITSNLDSKANHRLLAKNIINAAKRKNSPSPGALSSHSLPISPLGNSPHGYECNKPSVSPFQSCTSPPPTPTHRICSPVRLYNTRSLTDSDASVESEDSGLRSPGLYTYNTCPRGWGGSLRVKRSSVSTDL